MSTFTTDMDAGGYPIRILMFVYADNKKRVDVYTEDDEGEMQKLIFSGSLEDLDKHRLILSCTDRKLESIKHAIYDGWESQ